MSTSSLYPSSVAKKIKKHSKLHWLPLSLGLSWDTAHEDLPTRLATNALGALRHRASSRSKEMSGLFRAHLLNLPNSDMTVETLKLNLEWLVCTATDVWPLSQLVHDCVGVPIYCFAGICATQLLLLLSAHIISSSKGVKRIWCYLRWSIQQPTGLVSQRGTRHLWATTLTSQAMTGFNGITKQTKQQLYNYIYARHETSQNWGASSYSHWY